MKRRKIEWGQGRRKRVRKGGAKGRLREEEWGEGRGKRERRGEEERDGERKWNRMGEGR
jgi:hypothetical protein